MAATTTKKSKTIKKTTAKAPAKKRTKKRYVDGNLEFKTKSLLDYHLELKGHLEEGLIESFEVPTVDKMEKTGRYKTFKITINGHKFDSMAESKYYIHLLQEKKSGNVIDLELQPRYELHPSFKKIDKATGKKKTIRKTEYVADFLVTDKNNETTIYDVKGTLTEVFRLKRKWFDVKYPDLTLVCVKLDDKSNSWVTV